MFQPHTYTRTYNHLDDFAKVLSEADHVILLDIYASREKDTGLVSSKDLRDKIEALGGVVTYCPTFNDAEKYAVDNCRKGDMLITMGAGDVYKIGEKLVRQ